MSHDPDTSHDAGKSSPAYTFWLALVFFVFAYPLSVGPVARLYKGTKGPPQPLQAVYAPVVALYEHSSAARKFFDWYLSVIWDAK